MSAQTGYEAKITNLTSILDKLITALHAEHTEGLPRPYRDLVDEAETTMALVILKKGLRVRTLKGEIDTGNDGEDRITSPGSLGELMYENTPNQWSVNFGEASVHIEEHELRDPEQYEILPS